MPSPSPDWWPSFFDLAYGHGELTATTEERRRKIEELAPRIAALLRVDASCTVFDQCCGMGRMSHALGRIGVRTVGVDLSAEYVAAATTVAERESLPCTFTRGDAFEFVPPAPCDAGLNWFTSFGYSEDDRRNARMLERMRDAIRPGGRFLLEILSVPRLFASFRAMNFHRSIANDGQELVVLSETQPDFRTAMLEARWTFIWPDGRRDVRRVSTRMYMPHELVRMCEAVGFRVMDLLGDAAGTPYDRESPRLLVLCER